VCVMEYTYFWLFWGMTFDDVPSSLVARGIISDSIVDSLAMTSLCSFTRIGCVISSSRVADCAVGVLDKVSSASSEMVYKRMVFHLELLSRFSASDEFCIGILLPCSHLLICTSLIIRVGALVSVLLQALVSVLLQNLVLVMEAHLDHAYIWYAKSPRSLNGV
ncbi:hypothetical protein Drorol1_Dr00021954, partial [Drosera rotundifolia]